MKKLSIVFLIISILMMNQSYAQKKANGRHSAVLTTADTLNNLTKEFTSTFNNFSKTLDKGSVLKFMDKSVSALLTNTNISKNVLKFKSDYKGFEMYLDKMADSAKNEIILTYKLIDIVRTYINEDMGVVTYTADYSLRKHKKMWTKGHETVVLAYKRLGAEWRIIHYTTTTIEDQKLYGECSCEFVELKDGSFDTKTLIPSGKSYEEKKNEIVFEEVLEGSARIRRIKANGKIYRWDLSSKLFYIEQVEIKATTIDAGTAPTVEIELATRVKTKQKVIETIMLHNYQENCKEVKTRSNK